MEPVKIEFILKGDIERELKRVQLAMKGVGDESYTSFNSLLSQSDKAFDALGAANQKLALSVQENINALRALSADQRRLDDALESGTLTTEQYARSKAALTVQELNLRNAISTGMRELNDRLAAEKQAVDSVTSLNKHLQELTSSYYSLSKADREGAVGQGLLKQISGLEKQVTTAQSRLSAYSRAAGAGFNSLSMSVQQVARELPSLTMGANMFFLAISNNLPILADNIRTARTEYDLMKKSGQAAVPVWKQVLTSIVSWQTALVVGVTLLSVYGKELVNWAAALFKGGQAAQIAAEAQKTLNSLHEEAAKSAAKETAQLQLLYGVTRDATRTIDERTAAAEKLQKLYPDYFGNLSTEIILIGRAKKVYEALAKSIEDAARARILEEKYASSINEMTQAIKKRSEALSELDELKKKLTEQTKNPLAINYEEVARTRAEIVHYTEQLNDADAAIEAINKSYRDFQDAYKDPTPTPVIEQSLTQSKYYEDYTKKLEELRKSLSLAEISQDEFNKRENDAIGVMVKAAEAAGISDAALQKYTERYKEFNRLEQQKKTVKTTIAEAKYSEAAGVTKAETALRYLEIDRQKEDLKQKQRDAELELRQQKINLMENGVEKELEQIRLNYDKKINEIRKKEREYILAQQKIEQAQWENANSGWKKKGLIFTPVTTTVSQLPTAQREELSNATSAADSAREKSEAALLEKILKQYQDYAARRLDIEEKYNDDIAYLSRRRTQKNKEEINVAIEQALKGKKKALSALALDELKDTDLWAKMFGDLNKLALPSLEELLRQAKAVNTSAWDPENVKEYQAAIERLEKAINSRSPFKAIEDDWKKLLKGLKEGNKDDVTSALAGIDTAVQQLNGDLKTIAGGIGDVFGEDAGYAAEQVAALTSALSGFASAAFKIASGDILGGVGSIISSIGSVFSIGRKVKEMNRQAREEVQKYYDAAIAGEREYQLLIRERERSQQEMGESVLAYNKRITSELAKQQKASADEYNRLWEQIQGEQYVSGIGYKHGTWFRKAKTWSEYSALAGKSYEDIERLYTEGKLEEKVAKLFEQLRDLKEEGVDINQMLSEQKEAMREAWTGTTSNGIADSIIQGFSEGKRGAEDFADDFQGMLNNAVLQGIKLRALEEPLRKWYENYAQASEDGLTAAKIAELKSQYDKIITDAARQLEDMEQVTGATIGTADASRQAVAKGIQAVSQDSFDEFMGSVNALQYITYNIGKDISEIQSLLYQAAAKWIEIEENTRYCRRLESIEKDIKEMKNGIGLIANKGVIIRR